VAREFGKMWFSMYTDEDFARQPIGDKWLYQVLIGQPGMNYAGVQTINMRRWRKALRDGDAMPSEAEIEKRLIRLEAREFVFTDDETGEVLIRSFMRSDKIVDQPNVLKSALRDAGHVESPKIAAVLLSEIERLGDPKIKTTTPAGTKLRASIDELKAAAIAHLEGRTEGISEPFPKPFTEGLEEPLQEGFSEGLLRPGETEGFTEPFPKPLAVGSVVVEVEVEDSPSRGGSVGVRARTVENVEPQPIESPIGHTEIPSEPANDAEPPQRCAKHRAVPADGTCGPCANFRKAHANWTARQARRHALAKSAAARQAAEVRRAAINQCPMCDDRGYVGTALCGHDPQQAERNAEGADRVRQALAAAKARRAGADSAPDGSTGVQATDGSDDEAVAL